MQNMAVAAGWLLCLCAALAAVNAQSFSCSDLQGEATILYQQGVTALGIDGEQPPPDRLCQAQGSQADTYTAITLFNSYVANNPPPPPGVPNNGIALVDVVCTQSGMWMRVNQTAVTMASLASTTLRTDCYTCGVEHMATSFCAGK